jgi:hypothetical protein
MNAHARRVIRVEAGQIDILSTQAEDELIGSGLPVFQRGGMLVRPTAWEVPASDDVMLVVAFGHPPCRTQITPPEVHSSGGVSVFGHRSPAHATTDIASGRDVG